MATPNRFKTKLASDLTNMISATSFLGGAITNGIAQVTNDRWQDFESTGVRRREEIVDNSVSGSLTRNVQTNNPSLVIAGRFNPYGNTLYGNIDSEKANRIYEYRLMASFPEVTECLEKICNQFICEDERGHVVQFRYLDEDITAEAAKDLEEEFTVFSNRFHYQEKGKTYCLDFLVDGEVFLELVIDNETPETRKEGVIGVLKLPTELMSVSYKDKTNGIVGSFVGRAYDLDQADQNHILGFQYVPYHPNEVFYVNSDTWDPSGEWVVPFIERARKRYIQLSYLEDAIVIYRLVRAPERLVFTVDTGTMPAPDAERYLRELQQAYWKQKTVDINKGDIMQKFEPQSMLDAFWIAKGEGHEGTTISNLPGGQNLGQLDDLMYFIKALYRAMHVPSAYLDPSAQESIDQASILQEQLELAEFVISIQRRFAEAHKQAFITHLMLKGKWEEYKLKEELCQVTFNVPNSYYTMRRTQNMQLVADAFKKVVDTGCISKVWAMKRIMGLTVDEILTNLRLRKKEAAQEWEIAQIEREGPDWKRKYLEESLAGAMELAGAAETDFDGGGLAPEAGEPAGEFGAMEGVSDADLDMADAGDAAMDNIGEA